MNNPGLLLTALMAGNLHASAWEASKCPRWRRRLIRSLVRAALNLRKAFFFTVLTVQNDPEASRKGTSPISKEPTSYHHTSRDCISTREGGVKHAFRC